MLKKVGLIFGTSYTLPNNLIFCINPIFVGVNRNFLGTML